MDHTKTYIITPNAELAPVGVVGHLCLAGADLPRGYLGKAASTASAFTPDPFSNNPGARVYRTGDLARRLPDGTVEIIGRVSASTHSYQSRSQEDSQLIENLLLQHPEVTRAAVLTSAQTERVDEVLAYVVTRQAGENEVGEIEAGEFEIEPAGLSTAIRQHLKQQAAPRRLPSKIIRLAAMPVTSRGEVDRKALLATDLGGVCSFEPPRGELETRLARVWQEVLGLERVGRHDNFFDLGGHSLLAARLVNLIRQEFSTELPLRALFEAPTVASLSERVGAEQQTSIRPPVTPAPRDQPLPLSYSQRRLWFIDKLGAGSAQYNMPDSHLVNGELDLGAFERALASMVERHEVLRTHFVEEDGEPRQVIATRYALPMQLHDLSSLSEQERDSEATRLMREERRTPFDLSRDLMVRVRVLKLADRCHLILYTMHHIASDGWSRGIFRSELAALYSAYASGKENPLPPLPIQYADYAQWQRHWLQGEVLEQQLSYWRDQLKGLPPVHSLPLDKPRPTEQTFRGSSERIALPAALSEQLQALSREHGATMFMTLLSAFAVLLGRYSGQQDVAVGTPIANRPRRETEGLIGFLLNTLVMRNDLRGDPSFVDLLKRTREMALQAYAHQDIPFEHLVEKLNPQRSLSHSPLFQVMFMLQNAPFEALELSGLAVQPLRNKEANPAGEEIAQEGTARFDLTLSVQESPAGLVGSLEYNTDLFERDTIRRMLKHYARLLQAVAGSPEAPLSRLAMLGEDEQRRQLIEWNATARAYPQQKCIHELFEERAEQTPDRIALVHESNELTYRELNRQANRLAQRLLARGVGPEVRVGLCMPRSLQMVIGILGILKAGGCYVPLDPDYPRKRLDYLLEDARIEIVVTEPGVASRVTGPGRDVLLIDPDALERSATGTSENLDRKGLGLCPDHPAYLIYTSASTGAPKGVLGLHRSIVNRVSWLAGALGVGADEVLCQKTSVGFVDHVAEIFQALSAGVPLVIIPPSLLQTPGALLRALDARAVTQLTLVPSLLKSVLAAAQGEQAARLRSIYSSGEALHLVGLERFAECFPHARLINIYGSTEMGADVTYQEVAVESVRSEGASPWAPIGKAIDNTQVYILDADGRLAVPGAVGELHVGGVCLSRGYFNRAGLTAERFVPHPFSAEPGARVYRTGDLARWRPGGILEYLGRVDHQVKVRGFRIELGEIESELLAHEAVRDAVVVMREDSGDKRLVCYVVAKSDAPVDELALIQELRSRLHEQLPAYMVPSAFMVLESLPLTATGKVDRNALPAPDSSALAVQKYVSPQGEIESALACIWQDLLNVERVGRLDNFFALGGHSLLAVQLSSLVRQQLDIDLPISIVFNEPTLAALARHVERLQLARRPLDGQEVFEEGVIE